MIPFFNEQRESFLEYDLTQMVHRLSRTRAPKLGLMGNLSLELGQAGASAIMQGRFEPYLIYEELSQSFEIESLSPDIDRLPDDVDVLMIVHPASFPPKTLYAIDQFVLRGGKVLAFIDPLSEMAQQPPSPMGGMPEGPGLESTLDPLLQAWGVRFLTSEVVADRNRALRVQGGQATGLQLSDYVVWLGLRSEDFDAEDPVTSDIGLVQLASAGALTPIPDATTTITPLLQTTSDSMLFSTDEVAMNFNPDDLLRSFESSGERFIIGARISGEVSTAFPDGPPPGESDTASGDAGSDEVDDGLNDEPLPEHQSQSAGPINVIVIADTDLLDDRFWVNVQEFLGQRLVVPTADNATLVINAVDNLMGSSDLIGLRSRGKDERPLTAIEELRRQANDRFLLQEQELVRQLTETENRLAALQGQGGDAEGDIGLTLTPEQEAEIERFQVQLLETRRRLREVQRSLRTDIDALQNTVQFINIALMPILVACVAMGLALYRRRQRQLSRGQSYAGVQS